MNPDEKSRETPPWTMFFEGPLYRKYDEFMRHHDFSKILENKRRQLSKETNKATEKNPDKRLDPWENPEYDNAPVVSPFKPPSLDSYEYEEDRRRRRRRTCCFICSAMLIIVLLSLATALVIHYVFIVPKDGEYKAQVNVSVEETGVKPNASLIDTDARLSTTTSKSTASSAAPKDGNSDEIHNLLDTISESKSSNFFEELFKSIPERLRKTNKMELNKLKNTKSDKTSTTPVILSSVSTATSERTSSEKSETTSISHLTTSKVSSMDITTLFSKLISTVLPTTSQEVSTALPITTKDVSTVLPTTTNEASTVLSTTTEEVSTVLPVTTNKASTVLPTITKAVSTVLPTITDDVSTVLPTTTEETSTVLPTTNDGVSTVLHTTTEEKSIVLPTTTDKVSTVVPTITDEVSTVLPTATEEVSTMWPATTEEVSAMLPTTIDEVSTFLSGKTDEVSTVLPTTTEEVSTVLATTTEEVSTVLPTTSEKVSTVLPTTTNEVSTVLPTTTNEVSTVLPTKTDEVATVLSTSTKEESTVLPTTTNEASTVLPTTTEKISTVLPTTTDEVSTVLPTTTDEISTLLPTTTDKVPTALPTTTIASSAIASEGTTSTTATSSTTSTLSTTVTITTTPGTTTTTTTTEPPTTLPPIYNVVTMKDVTAYTFEPAKVHCDVKVALKWSSLAIKGKKGWRPLELKLYPDGHVSWKSKTTRHKAEYVIEDGYGGVGNNVTLNLIIDNVQCRDGDVYSCILFSEVVDMQAKNKLTTVAKPGKTIRLSLGPSIIENRAVRLTVTWDGGYPIPWTNVTWTAVDRNNNSYDLSTYGEYREFILRVDDHFCQTRMQQDFVIFPKMHLNGTTIIVKPDLTKTKPFVSDEMSAELLNVEPGIQSILVIPLDYCKSGKQEAIPHPYEDCKKFVWCLPGDLVVQQCPFGTCFYEKHGECLGI